MLLDHLKRILEDSKLREDEYAKDLDERGESIPVCWRTPRVNQAALPDNPSDILSHTLPDTCLDTLSDSIPRTR